MKIQRPYLIALYLVLFSGFAASQPAEIRFENKRRTTVGFLDGSGRIQDASRSTKGYISNGKIEDAGRKTIGFISKDGRIEDASRTTIGYVNPTGRVENASRSTIGYVKLDGRVEDSKRSTIGYVNGYKASMLEEVACFWFFFFTP